MDLHVHVVSQHPPGGRCTLYAGCATHLGAQPADELILMPADLCALQARAGQDAAVLAGVLEAPLQRMMEDA